MEFITEERYEEQMRSKVLPYLDERRSTGTFETLPGQKLYYEVFKADQPKAELVLVHGFSEGIGKFSETIYYFLRSGISVYQLQQREHGLSYRSTDDRSLINITDFKQLVKDLHNFMEKIVKPARVGSELPLYLYGHSMGGGVSACYIEDYPADFDKVILSSPMLEMDAGGTPLWAAKAAARTMIALGKGANWMPGAQAFTGEYDFEGSNTDCEARYAFWNSVQKAHPEYHMCVPSFASALQFFNLTKYATNAKKCARVDVPVLLFQAGKDKMVKPDGQSTFIKQIGDKGRLIRVEEAQHEIYLSSQEILENYWKEILDFLG